MHKLAVLSLGMLLVLAGCATTAPKPTPTFNAYPGIDANELADHILGCTDIATADVGFGSKSGMKSAATCMLNGHKVFIASWSTAADADLSTLFGQDAFEMYWAHGSAWTVFLADDPTPQYQITNDAASLYKRQLAGKTPNINADAARSIAKTAAKDLRGTVSHTA